MTARIEQVLLTEQLHHEQVISKALNGRRDLALLRESARWAVNPPLTDRAGDNAAVLRRQVETSARKVTDHLSAGLGQRRRRRTSQSPQRRETRPLRRREVDRNLTDMGRLDQRDARRLVPATIFSASVVGSVGENVCSGAFDEDGNEVPDRVAREPLVHPIHDLADPARAHTWESVDEPIDDLVDLPDLVCLTPVTAEVRRTRVRRTRVRRRRLGIVHVVHGGTTVAAAAGRSCRWPRGVRGCASGRGLSPLPTGSGSCDCWGSGGHCNT